VVRRDSIGEKKYGMKFEEREVEAKAEEMS